MHHSTPPDWSNWPPSSRAMPGHMNGHDLQLGQTLGMLLAHSDRQTRVLEQISDRLDDLPENIARALPAPPPTPPSARLSSRETAQLVLAAVIVVLALAGKVTIQEAVQLLAKPLGL